MSFLLLPSSPLPQSHDDNVPPPPAAAFVAHDPAAAIWYYRDPQHKVQGPVSGKDMKAWYDAGYVLIGLTKAFIGYEGLV